MAPTVYTPPIPTYTALQTTTLGSAAASVTFGNIPSTDSNGNTIRDLILVMNYTAASSVYAGKVYVNGDFTSSNYYWVYMHGTGSGSPTSSQGSSGSIRWQVQTTSEVMARVHFLDAKATDKKKTVLVRVHSATAGIEASAQQWLGTGAITSLTAQFGTNLLAGSTLSLYAVVA